LEKTVSVLDGMSPQLSEPSARRALELFYSDRRPEALALAAELLEDAALHKSRSAAAVRGLSRFVMASYALSLGNNDEVARHAEQMESDAAEYNLPELRVQALRLLATNERHVGRYVGRYYVARAPVGEALSWMCRLAARLGRGSIETRLGILEGLRGELREA
jgi:hypothetical protein